MGRVGEKGGLGVRGFEVVGLRGEGRRGANSLGRVKCGVEGPKGRIGEKGGRGF